VAVWSPKVEPIMFKMHYTSKDGIGNPTVNVEIEETTTVANA
jgi:hypothetical protein